MHYVRPDFSLIVFRAEEEALAACPQDVPVTPNGRATKGDDEEHDDAPDGDDTDEKVACALEERMFLAGDADVLEEDGDFDEGGGGGVGADAGVGELGNFFGKYRGGDMVY